MVNELVAYRLVSKVSLIPLSALPKVTSPSCAKARSRTGHALCKSLGGQPNRRASELSIIPWMAQGGRMIEYRPKARPKNL